MGPAQNQCARVASRSALHMMRRTRSFQGESTFSVPDVVILRIVPLEAHLWLPSKLCADRSRQMIDFRLGLHALGICVAVALLAGCGGSQPTIGATSAGPQPATRPPERSLQGYYLAKFTTEVGSSLPESSLCIRFKSSGSWSSSGSESFNGTYLTAGKELFASGVWFYSPVVYLSLQGSVNAKQGSGHFIISWANGYTSGGGTFIMTRKQIGCN